MCFASRVLSIGLIVAAFVLPTPIQAQTQSIAGPTLGYLTDTGGRAIWPIVGISGAAAMGNRLTLDADILGAVVSPTQNYAIALDAGSSQVLEIALASGASSPVQGASGADLIAISPTGSAAALYKSVPGTIQVVEGLPSAPEVVGQFDASGIEGRAVNLAVSDDGAAAIIQFDAQGSESLWTASASGPAVRLLFDSPTAAAFFPGKEDAIVADQATQSAYIIKGILNTATPISFVSLPPGMTGFSSISASDDGRSVFLADGSTGNIAIVDAQTGISTLTSCSCKPTGFKHLKGTSIFRLTETSSSPLMVLDASSQARVIPIPLSTVDTTARPAQPTTIDGVTRPLPTITRPIP